MRSPSLFACCFAVWCAPSWAAEPPAGERPAATATSEGVRLAGEYVVQRAGASWGYAQAGGKGRMSMDAFSDWRGRVSFSFLKRSGSAVWRVKDGVWLERNASRGEGEHVVLPATLSVGTRWRAAPSVERGGRGDTQYEVLALDAVVDLPNGHVVDHCLAVLETGLDGSAPHTHYYAPNMGKVAVRGPEDWLLRLVEFRAGGRGHQE